MATSETTTPKKPATKPTTTTGKADPKKPAATTPATTKASGRPRQAATEGPATETPAETTAADTINITYRASGRVARVLNEQVQRSEREGLNYSRQTLISQAILGYFGTKEEH